METVKVKRIKKVFSNSDQVIHLWANQSQTDARCKNVFFEGESIYSYGRHYELGRIVTYKGHKVAMINDRGCSATTSGYIGSAYHAVTHMLRIKNHKLGAEHIPDAMLRLQGEIVSRLMDVLSARIFYRTTVYGTKDDSEMSGINEFNNLCDKLGFKKLRLDVTDDFYSLLNEHVQRCLAREKELNSPEALAAKETKKLEKAKTLIVDWLTGKIQSATQLRDLNTQLIRVKGDTVQTTRGAEVSLVVAKKILSRIETGVIQDGESVGPFTFNSIDGDTVKIGCHKLSLKQCKEVLGPVVNLSLVSE